MRNMAVKIRIIRSVDYLVISDDGRIDFPESRKNLENIANDDAPSDCEILLDFRRTQWVLSTDEIYFLAEIFLSGEDTYNDRIALLLLPGVNFDTERFKDLCSRNKRNPLRTFTNYEDAIQWFYSK
jgi:hypothetical protein